MHTKNIKLSGVSYTNPDGSNRQELIARCRSGQRVNLIRDANNEHDRNAVSVENCAGQQLGYVPRDEAGLIASHLDRGGEVEATVERVLGGPTFLQRLFRIKGKHYGCVIRVVPGSFDWSKVTPWMDSDRAIGAATAAARKLENSDPEAAIEKYQEVVKMVAALDMKGSEAAAWRTHRHPVARLSLLLDKQKWQSEALACILEWERRSDRCGLRKQDFEAVQKRKVRLSALVNAEAIRDDKP